jgi:hypothetical protein
VTYRDENEALRARVEQLEGELALATIRSLVSAVRPGAMKQRGTRAHRAAHP